MKRFLVIVATIMVVISIAVAVWTFRSPPGAPVSVAPPVTAPQQFDTTGGQEMQPRWGVREEQGNDTAGN